MIRKIKQTIKRALPQPWLTSYYLLRFQPDDPVQVLGFLFRGWRDRRLGFARRLALVKRLYTISLDIDCPHTQSQILCALEAMYSAPEGCVVEAGCYKGGSTAKLSIGAKMTGRSLVVFDSFQGIPQNSEPHDTDVYGHYTGPFWPGSYCGNLAEVRRNVGQFGASDVCQFIQGWFDQTMPGFGTAVGVIYLDVDLVSSTKTCLRYLYPLLVPGGVLISQDGHLPLIIEVFNDEEFWKTELRTDKPILQKLTVPGLIKLTKPKES